MTSQAEAVYFGSPSLDVYAPFGDVGPDHAPGAKTDLEVEDEARMVALIKGGANRHVGGGALNALAYEACMGTEVMLMGVMGAEEDSASEFVRTHLNALGANNATVKVPGYRIGESLIERLHGQSDRMARIRCRDPIGSYLSNDRIANAIRGAQLVVAASIKDESVACRVFSALAASEDRSAFLAVNWGTSELKRYPGTLRNLMEMRRPNLLAVNGAELARICGEGSPAHDAAHAARLAKYATTHWAEHVVCTLGEAGMVLAGNGDSIFRKADPDPIGDKDTLGAGDRVLAVAARGIRCGGCPEDVLFEASRSAVSVIGSEGAHGDLYPHIYASV